MLKEILMSCYPNDDHKLRKLQVATDDVASEFKRTIHLNLYEFWVIFSKYVFYRYVHPSCSM